MKNTYNNFHNNIYHTLDIYGNTDRAKLFDTMFNNVVETYPDPVKPRGKQKSRRPLRVCAYRDFKVIETKNTCHGCWWTLVYKPTNEVVTTDAVAYSISWFVWWWYNHK